MLPAFRSLSSATLLLAAAPLAAQIPSVRWLHGFDHPGPVALDGDTLYVGSTSQPRVYVVDVATPGAEAIVGTLDTPIVPEDIELVHGRIVVYANFPEVLWHRPLAGGAWSAIPLSPGPVKEPVGNVLAHHPLENKVYVPRGFNDKIEVVDLDAGAVVATMTNLHDGPSRVAVTEDGTRLLALCFFSSVSGCPLPGPNAALFALPDLTKLYEVDLSGDCPLNIEIQGERFFVFSEFGLSSFDLADGAPRAHLDTPQHWFWAGQDRRQLLSVNTTQRLEIVNYELTEVEAVFTLLEGPVSFGPVIRDFAAAPPCDGRIFFSNLTGALTIVDMPSPYQPYGDACASPGGEVPVLSAQGCPEPGATVAYTVQGGAPGTPAVLLFGLSAALAPLGAGCTLYVLPFSPFTQPLALGPAGSATFTFGIAPAVPPGILLHGQAFLLADGAVSGTRALRAVTSAP